MDINQLEARAREVVSKGIVWGDSRELIDLHKALIGDKENDWYCLTCSNKMMQVFLELKWKYYQKPMAQQPGKYSFKDENASIRPFGMAEYVNASNLTDEKAEEIIKINPAYEQLFDVDESFVDPNANQTPSDDDQNASGDGDQNNQDQSQQLPEGSKPLRIKADYQARYEELYGVKPDESLTIDLLKGAIQDAEAKKEAEGK